MPVNTSYHDATPVELLQGPNLNPDVHSEATTGNSEYDEKARAYCISWRNQLRQQRIEKLNIWNECWSLYRGQEDFSNKEDWQSKIVLPKAWGTVKQAVNVIKRFLNTNKKPWFVDATNPTDPVGVLRAEKMTDLSKVFLDKAHFLEEFSVGLETAFIMGMGVWKIGWGLQPRTRMTVRTALVPAAPPPQGAPGNVPPGGSVPLSLAQGQPLQPPVERGNPNPVGQMPGELQQQQNQQYPNQLPNEAELPPGSLATGGIGPQAPVMIPTKQVVREEVMEGRLFVWAVDPYNFYWLPSSKFNRWTGTLEEMEVPKWQLMEMAKQGAFPEELVERIGPMKIDEYQKQTWVRFGELPRNTFGPTKETSTVKLTEFHGPLVIDGVIVEKDAHILIANDTYVLKNGKNDKWHRKPPYIAFSPLMLPFRAEGVGLVEMVRSIDKSLNQIINLGVDTLLFRLMPLFEMTPDVYENPEDLRTGITPGKILRRNSIASAQDMGLRPVEMNDVSPGAAQFAGILDRAHQEGGLVSEIQQSLPRWSGSQTATETEALQENQSSFFGSLAADIETFAISPIVEMAVDTIMQYLDTANDPRVATILGVGQQILAGMSQPEVLEMIQGDYEITVRGLTGQLEKAEMLQNLVQFMNLIGQNPQAWLPYINQDALLRRILESFRPSIHDIEEIIADPQTVQANKQAMQDEQQHGQIIGMLPELARLAHDSQQAQAQLGIQQSQMQSDQQAAQTDQQSKAVDQAIALKAAQNKGSSSD